MDDIIKKLAETILMGVDYDIYKEDLEEREILDEIEMHLYTLVRKLEESRS